MEDAFLSILPPFLFWEIPKGAKSFWPDESEGTAVLNISDILVFLGSFSHGSWFSYEIALTSLNWLKSLSGVIFNVKLYMLPPELLLKI